MILGVGVDLVEIARLEKRAEDERFLCRVFTKNERAYADARGAGRARSYAAMFAAKEAASKALGTGFAGFGLTDIEILHDAHGAPYLAFHGGAEQAARTRGVIRAFVSLTHERAYAASTAVLEG